MPPRHYGPGQRRGNVEATPKVVPVLVEVYPELVCDSYDGLVRALVALRHIRGFSQDQLEHITGLTRGHVGKLEVGPVKGRGLGALSLALLLGGLRAKLVLIPIDDKPRARHAA
jgi:hypothetical protein